MQSIKIYECTSLRRDGVIQIGVADISRERRESGRESVKGGRMTGWERGGELTRRNTGGGKARRMGWEKREMEGEREGDRKKKENELFSCAFRCSH